MPSFASGAIFGSGTMRLGPAVRSAVIVVRPTQLLGRERTAPQPPPIGDPEREAVASLRGYSYQMLQSIETWLDLGEGEALAVEGAEELDRIGLDGATAEQVKDTAGSGNVTLRSQAVFEANGNFWEHLRRNPGTPTRF